MDAPHNFHDPRARASGMSSLIFLGYRAKLPWVPTRAWDPMAKTGVVEVCSASDCRVKAPAGWERRGGFNRAGCYRAALDAIAPLSEADDREYATFAYWIVPGEGGWT